MSWKDKLFTLINTRFYTKEEIDALLNPPVEEQDDDAIYYGENYNFKFVVHYNGATRFAVQTDRTEGTYTVKEINGIGTVYVKLTPDIDWLPVKICTENKQITIYIGYHEGYGYIIEQPRDYNVSFSSLEYNEDFGGYCFEEIPEEEHMYLSD